MKKMFLFSIVLISAFAVLGQNLASVNVNGSRLFGDNSTGLTKKQDGGFLAFGTSANITVHSFDFAQGAKWELTFNSNNSSLSNPQLQGSGGIAENDTTFVVIGQLEIVAENSQVLIIKATENGTIVWARQLQTLTNDVADKIIKCQNGDYLVSIKTNLREDNFGGLVSGSALCRVSPSGNLLWYLDLDTRTDNISEILGFFELESQNIVIAQNYSEKLSLIKITESGDSLGSILSNDSLAPKAIDFVSNSEGFVVVTHDLGILKLDTSFGITQFLFANHSNLLSFNSVKTINDSTLAIGGRYLNEAAIINFNLFTNQVRNLYHHSFFSFAPAAVQGMFVLEDTFYSIVSNGFAINQHNSDLSNPCFKTIAGNNVSISSANLPDFTEQQISEEVQMLLPPISGITAIKNNEIQASVNCNEYDLSIRTQFLKYENSCRNVTLRWYVYNHGNVPIETFTIRYYYEGEQYEQTLTVSPIASKTGIFVDYGSLYLLSGESRVTYRVFSPNGMEDEFPLNDSLYVDYVTVPNVTISISANDSICEGVLNAFVATGPDGLYGLEKNGSIIVQSPSKTFTALGGGVFRIMFQDNQSCRFFSDSFLVIEKESPVQPTLFTSNDTLFSNAPNPNYWYFNSVLLDSNKSFFVYQGIGNYKVETRNQNNCFAQNELLNLNLRMYEPSKDNPFYVYENTLFWNGNQNATVTLFNLSGQKMSTTTLQENQQLPFQEIAGLYFVVIESGGNFWTTRVLIN